MVDGLTPRGQVCDKEGQGKGKSSLSNSVIEVCRAPARLQKAID